MLLICLTELTLHYMLSFTLLEAYTMESGTTSCLSIMYYHLLDSVIFIFQLYQPYSNSCATTSLNRLWYSFHEVSYLLRKYMLNTVVLKCRRRNSRALSGSVTWKGGCISLPLYFKSKTTFGIPTVSHLVLPVSTVPILSCMFIKMVTACPLYSFLCFCFFRCIRSV